MNKMITRPVYLEVNLDNLKHNLNIIKNHVDKNSKIIAVVKANAYGFGIQKISQTLIEEGIDYFAVATMSEALEIRRNNKEVRIMILGYNHKDLYKRAIENKIELTIFNILDAKNLNEVAKNLGKSADINLAFETGMNRIGFIKEDLELCIEEIQQLKNLNIVGAFSHFAASDSDDSYTRLQYKKFIEMVNLCKEHKLEIPLKHINNSHGIINYREFDLDAVRPGIILYGSCEFLPHPNGFDLKYLGSIKSKIANLKTISPGEKVSYGLTFEAKRKTKVATIPVGYADGFIRNLSGKIEVLINGKRCKQIGRICMDQMMIDVTDASCKVDDQVVLLGKQDNEEITIEEIAEKAGEIATSYSCHFSNRLPRVYIKNGKIDEVYDELYLL